MSENKGDLISRSALGVGPRNPEQFVDPERARGWNDLLEIINVAPAVDAQPVVHGRWSWRGCDRWNDSFQCSECGVITMDDSCYCPNCGAKMDGGDTRV